MRRALLPVPKSQASVLRQVVVMSLDQLWGQQADCSSIFRFFDSGLTQKGSRIEHSLSGLVENYLEAVAAIVMLMVAPFVAAIVLFIVAAIVLLMVALFVPTAEAAARKSAGASSPKYWRNSLL